MQSDFFTSERNKFRHIRKDFPTVRILCSFASEVNPAGAGWVSISGRRHFREAFQECIAHSELEPVRATAKRSWASSLCFGPLVHILLYGDFPLLIQAGRIQHDRRITEKSNTRNVKDGNTKQSLCRDPVLFPCTCATTVKIFYSISSDELIRELRYSFLQTIT